ncbi:hypothetical protein OIU84_004538 [Salix udensis]|uniref:Uncharacterized protein n=1 Tax=Salix udensis TaxID=889485 RepID=A0AAD6K2D8_9ROSI|nr:hypothetical protein OIU84_004538 [Salix udensis]
MASPPSAPPWSRSNVLVSTSSAVAPPCLFAGIFRVMISQPAIAYKVLSSYSCNTYFLISFLAHIYISLNVMHNKTSHIWSSTVWFHGARVF